MFSKLSLTILIYLDSFFFGRNYKSNSIYLLSTMQTH